MQGASLLKFCDPDVTKWHTTSLAPLADGFEACRDVAGSPVVDTAIRQSDEPDVFSMSVGNCKTMKVTACPHCSAQTLDATFSNEERVKADLKTIRVTCFRWDKPSGFAARSLPACGVPSPRRARGDIRRRK